MRCLFDNQMPLKLARAINELEGKGAIAVEHLRDKFKHDISDVEWMQRLAEEGDWFVITKDNKIREKSYEIEIWKTSNLPIVFLPSDPWMKYRFWDTAWRLVKYWPLLRERILDNKNNESFILTAGGDIRQI